MKILVPFAGCSELGDFCFSDDRRRIFAGRRLTLVRILLNDLSRKCHAAHRQNFLLDRIQCRQIDGSGFGMTEDGLCLHRRVFFGFDRVSLVESFDLFQFLRESNTRFLFRLLGNNL